MAVFIDQDITNAGLLLLAKAQAGAELTFTKIVIGSGYLPSGTTPRNIEAVVEPVTTLDIVKKEINEDRTATIGGVFTNAEITKEFYYRELALFAQDPDLGEILYCYGNAGDTAELIPAHGSATLVEKLVDIVTIIGDAQVVSAFMSSGAYASMEAVEKALAAANAAQADIDLAKLRIDGLVLDVAALQAENVDLRARVADNAAKTNLVYDAIFTDITTNPFLVTFGDLAGITFSAGIWNKSLARLEC